MKQILETLPLAKAREQEILSEIDYDNDKNLQEGSSWEMTNLIYDTLFENKQFPQFNVSHVEETECDAKNRYISFEYMGYQYGISVHRV